MGLTARLLRFATARPRAFVVTAPGAAATRLLVEVELRRRDGSVAVSPAGATTLIVCGHPREGLAKAVDVIWADMPGPRSLVRLGDAVSGEEVVAALDRADRELADATAQRAGAMARQETGPWAPGDGHDTEETDEHGDHMSGHENGGHEGDGHADHDQSSSDEDDEEGKDAGHGDHGGHEHHMGAPMGLDMAGRAPDRDGLMLDVLHIPFGPALPDWPAGLVLNLTVQGDVLQAVEVTTVGGTAGGASFWDEPWLRAAAGERVPTGEAERRRAASHLDSVGRLLAVGGWRSAADDARVLRDHVLADRAGDELAPRIAKFARRTGKSRALRWMLRGVGVIDQPMVDRHGLTGPAADHRGDAFVRLAGWLDEIKNSIARVDDPAPLDGIDAPRGPIGRTPSAAVLAVLPELLEGAELSEARLTVASLDPDLDQFAVLAGAAGE